MQFKGMEAEGAALAAADYENRANAAAQGVVQGVIGAAGTALAAVPLFQATKGVKAASDVADLYAGTKNFSPDLLDASGKPLSYEQAVIKRFGMSDEAVKALPIYDKTGKIDSKMFNDWLSSQPKSDINQILKSGFGPSQLGGVKGDIFPYEAFGENKFQTSRADALRSLYDQYSSVSSPSSTQFYDNLSWMGNPSRN
jgi:hypothetical protein